MNLFFSHAKGYKVIFNALSLLFSLFFSGLLFVILCFPSFSNSVSEAVVSRYESSFVGKSDLALAQLKQGNVQAVLELLRVDFAVIQKGDRAYGQKRALLMALCANFYQKGNYQELRHWADVWFSLDDRDVSAMAYYYQAVWLLKQEPEALTALMQLMNRFPENKLVQQFVRQNSVS